MTDAEALEALTARQTIAERIYRYCRSVDRLDIPLGHSIWHEDGVADYGEAIYQGPGRPRPTIRFGIPGCSMA